MTFPDLLTSGPWSRGWLGQIQGRYETRPVRFMYNHKNDLRNTCTLQNSSIILTLMTVTLIIVTVGVN